METKPTVEEPLPQSAEQTSQPSGKSESVVGVAAAVAAQHGAGTDPGNGKSSGEAGGSGKRGRPVVHGLYSKAMGSDGKNPVRQAGPGTVVQDKGSDLPPRVEKVVVPAELLAEVVQEALTTTEEFVGCQMEDVGKKAGLTIQEIEPQLKQGKMGEKRKALLGKLTPLALKEHGLDAEVSPTVAIGVIFVPWALSAGTAYMTLARLAREKAERDRKKESNP